MPAEEKEDHVNTLHWRRVFLILMETYTRAVLYVNGESVEPLAFEPLPDDFNVAVDGGLRHMLNLGVLPHLLVGDLDSLSPELFQTCISSGVEILKFPSIKDQTDLEIALEEVLRRGHQDIVVAYAMGGRFDHLLGNLALFGLPLSARARLHFDDGVTEVYLVTADLEMRTSPGDVVSLIPWQGDAYGVCTLNLAYPLTGEPLFANATRGISNLAQADSVQVTVAHGSLLVVRTRQPYTSKGGTHD